MFFMQYSSAKLKTALPLAEEAFCEQKDACISKPPFARNENNYVERKWFMYSRTINSINTQFFTYGLPLACLLYLGIVFLLSIQSVYGCLYKAYYCKFLYATARVFAQALQNSCTIPKSECMQAFQLISTIRLHVPEQCSG